MEKHPEMVAHVGDRMTESAREFSGPQVAVRGMILDYSGEVLFDSASETAFYRSCPTRHQRI
jgi:hypothetical protein